MVLLLEAVLLSAMSLVLGSLPKVNFMERKQYDAPKACVLEMNGVDIVTGSGTYGDNRELSYKSFSVSWLPQEKETAGE
jgi:hypothetical protein